MAAGGDPRHDPHPVGRASRPARRTAPRPRNLGPLRRRPDLLQRRPAARNSTASRSATCRAGSRRTRWSSDTHSLPQCEDHPKRNCLAGELVRRVCPANPRRKHGGQVRRLNTEESHPGVELDLFCLPALLDPLPQLPRLILGVAESRRPSAGLQLADRGLRVVPELLVDLRLGQLQQAGRLQGANAARPAATGRWPRPSGSAAGGFRPARRGFPIRRAASRRSRCTARSASAGRFNSA